MRFLTTEQALADTAFFAKNIVFEGFEDEDLTAAKNAYIAYGGSYAGAFVSFLRVQYPDVFWGKSYHVIDAAQGANNCRDVDLEKQAVFLRRE